MNPLLRQLLSYARRASNFFAPRNVGVHHTFYGAGPDAAWMPTWRTPFVRPSTVPTGQLGVTAGDQIPGMSYFWSAGGRGGAREAANLARGQTSLQFQRAILEPGTQGVAKVTTTPRFGPIVDPNLPGTRARMIPGETGQRVVGEVVSPAGPLSEEGAREVARLVNQQKAREAARSASRVAAAGAAAAAQQGFWRSVMDSFLSDPATNMDRMEAQRNAGNTAGAAGSYIGTLAQGSQGMALSAGLAPVSAPKRSQQAQSARYTAQGNSLVPRLTPPSAPRPAPRVVQPRRTGGGGTNRFF